MYYRRQDVTSNNASLEPDQISINLQTVYRQYHSNNRIVQDARKVTDASNGEDTTVYESKAVMDQFDADCKALTDMGSSWGTNLTWTTSAEGEIASVSDVDWVAMDKGKSFAF
ncbi:uncharacterized protein METZ01_LOCUS442293 [marine metagenome]|uniref:Uncharacterized protein n=1 Tax=marine metagenome TaxID=408172 RepID=A0A382Z2N0_9ZZZZ